MSRRREEYILDWVKEPADRLAARREMELLFEAEDFRSKELRGLAEHYLQETLELKAKLKEAQSMAGMGALKCVGCGEAVAKFCSKCVMRSCNEAVDYAEHQP